MMVHSGSTSAAGISLGCWERRTRRSGSRRELAFPLTIQDSRYRYSAIHILAVQRWLLNFGCRRISDAVVYLLMHVRVFWSGTRSRRLPRWNAKKRTSIGRTSSKLLCRRAARCARTSACSVARRARNGIGNSTTHAKIESHCG